MTEAKTYDGSCHCGAVTFTAETDLSQPFQCNCLRCSRLNTVMHSVTAEGFKLLSGADRLKTYHFNTHTIDHQFCTDCGIQPFSSGKDKAGNTAYVINVHCLAGAEYDPASITRFNGADF